MIVHKRKKKEESSLNKIIRSKRFLMGLLMVFTLLMFLFFKKASLFMVFIIIQAIITYYTKLYHVPVDLTPLFFLQTVITRYYGLDMTLLFILLGYIVPKLMAGSGMNWLSYAYVSLSFSCNVLSLLFPNMSLQLVGYITSVIQYVGGIFITMLSKPFALAAADGLANVTNNLLWFLIFSDLIVFLLGI